jgi:hypothetical protein
MRRAALIQTVMSVGFAGLMLALLGTGGEAQTPTNPLKVTISDGKQVAGDLILPLDPKPRAQVKHVGGFAFGLTVDNKRITFDEQQSVWCNLRVDGQEFPLGFGAPGMGGQQPPRPLPPGPAGKKRSGYEVVWNNNAVRVTQTVELVPGRPTLKGVASDMRRLDTYRISYVVENIAKDGRARKIEMKSAIDTLIVQNDGALFAAPTTHPGKILNGTVLRGKQVPDYVQVLERPDLNNPGFVATLTFKHNKGDNPNVFVMTNTASIFNGWEPPAQQAGDSACCILWDAKEVKPGEKRVMVWAYGGGFATDPENDGKVSLALGGSFEPNKLFTITALVEDPGPSQALTLELPPGMERVEGREVQPVPPAGEASISMVLWKARVLRTGDFDIRVRSSNGVTHVKRVSIQPASN